MSDTLERGVLFRKRRIARGFARAHRRALLAFGDNLERAGFGGQARELRGEPNAVGVPTKWSPRRGPGAYFRDEDWNLAVVRGAIHDAFDRLSRHLCSGEPVYLPLDGLGTGLADLPNRAPLIYGAIAYEIAALEKVARRVEVLE